MVTFFGFVMVKRSSSGTELFFLGEGKSSIYKVVGVQVVALCNCPAALDANANYSNYTSVYMLILVT